MNSELEIQPKEGAVPPPYYDIAPNSNTTPYRDTPHSGYGQSNAGRYVDPQSDPNYGYDRNDDQPIILQPGIMATTPEPYADVPDYLVLSIISILFCTCLGVVSILKASNARTSKAAGRYQTALKESKTALQTGISAIVIGIILTAIIVVIQVVAAQQTIAQNQP